jgi:hypothetical protein
LANAFFRTAPAATRIASTAEFAAVEPSSPKPAAAMPSGIGRHFSREALKYFGITFVVCALALAAIFYFLMPKAPTKPVPMAPALPQPKAAQPAPSSKTAQPAPPPQADSKADVKSPDVKNQDAKHPDAKNKVPAKAHAKKKAEPDVDVKPAEPKIIRQ